MTSTCTHWLSRLAPFAALLVVTACAGPTVVNTQWTDPQFSAKPIRSIVVVGITQDTTNRRVYEDAMVAQLGARGVKALPSYTFAPAPGAVSPEVMQKALTDFGAKGVLLTQVVNVSQSVQVTPGMNTMPPRGAGFGGFNTFYGGMWASSFQAPPTITVRDNVVADTRLFEAKDFALVWSASTTTTTIANGSGTTASLLQQFATLIADTLAKDGMI
jgi:hypothetical protein